jgi:hypothetical protein
MKQDTRKRVQINEGELGWRDFLVDEDALAALPFLNRAVRSRLVQERLWPAPPARDNRRRDFI